MTFEDWLKTERGISALTWPVTEPIYLRNRLWWAFTTGSENHLPTDPTDRLLARHEQASTTMRTALHEIMDHCGPDSHDQKIWQVAFNALNPPKT